ncbi:unnamed protein product [Cuscuta epithymum]|uniref:Protein kinase domain-containing protein n=1 Tax=Cuscuta epithymum TaxID=186058 RepID=A0AAV0DI50_9ASTE|nr:unnamed protein product [Cuscuta epithymum]
MTDTPPEKKQKIGDVLTTGDNTEGIEILRQKLHEWGHWMYYYQTFNKELDYKPQYQMHVVLASEFDAKCSFYSSNFSFSMDPVIIGGVKPCSYSELESITDFKVPCTPCLKAYVRRLFSGTIDKGFEKRPVIVKTWDFPFVGGYYFYNVPDKFCDLIEFYTDPEVRNHPNLAKLSMYCYEKRLAAVFDEKFTVVLSEMLLDDEFGWHDRIWVATQLAELLAWLHRRRIAVGSVEGSSIMVDEEMNIKVLGFGCVSRHIDEDSKLPVSKTYYREAYEVLYGGVRMMKSDVFVFGILLVELIAKKKYSFEMRPHNIIEDAQVMAANGKKGLVHESFKEVNDDTAKKITDFTLSCLDEEPTNRHKMAYVFEFLANLRGMSNCSV